MDFLLENPPCKEAQPPDILLKSALRAEKRTKIRVFSPRSGISAACLKGRVHFSGNFSSFKFWLHSKSDRLLDGKMLFDNLVGQVSDRTPRHHAASVENRKIIRELLAKIEVLFNQKDCHGALTAEQVEGGLDFVS